MTDSLREQLYQNVETTMEGITIANGYVSTVGTTGLVTRGLMSPLETFRYPVVSVLPVSDQPDLGAQVLRRVLTFTARLWIDDTAANAATTLEALIADVQRAMQVDGLRSGLAELTREGALQYLYMVSTDRLAGADINYELYYKTPITTPFESA